jgi:hypothetical protein
MQQKNGVANKYFIINTIIIIDFAARTMHLHSLNELKPTKCIND